MRFLEDRRLNSPADKVSVVLVIGLVILGGIYIVTATVAQSYAMHHCAGVAPTGWVRNHHVAQRPVCREGAWTVTIPREHIDRSVYGWNCYLDADVCDVDHLTSYEPFCQTDDSDGYTMCQDGRVYHRTPNGGVLDEVIRAPRDTAATPSLN